MSPAAERLRPPLSEMLRSGPSRRDEPPVARNRAAIFLRNGRRTPAECPRAMKFWNLRLRPFPTAGTLFYALLAASTCASLATISCESLTCAELLNCEGGSANSTGGSLPGPGPGAGGDAGGPGAAGGEAGSGAGGAATGGEGGDSRSSGGADSTVPLGLALTVPRNIRVRQGGKQTLSVQVERKGGLGGELTVSFTGLPEGVVSEPVVLEEGEEEADLEIAAKAGAEQTPGLPVKVIAEGPDGMKEESEVRLVVAGDPGTLEESFGSGGLVRSEGPFSSVTIASDEAIWVAGNDEVGALRLYRFERYGEMSWSVQGRGQSWYDIVSSGDRVIARFSDSPGVGTDVLRAFRLDGSVDKKFGDEGLVSLGEGIPSYGDRVATGSDGSLALANSKSTVLLEANGQPRPNFAYFDPAEARPTALAFDSKGRILTSWLTSDSAQYFMSRARPDGRLDASFGTTGKAVADLGLSSSSSAQTMRAARIWVRPDDSALLFAISSPNENRVDIIGNELAMLSFKSTGELDEKFGSEGKVVIGSDGALSTGILTEEGDVIVVYSLGYSREGRLAQYNDRGILNENFGEDGQVELLRLVSAEEVFNARVDVAYDPSAGRVIVAFSTLQFGYLASYWL